MKPLALVRADLKARMKDLVSGLGFSIRRYRAAESDVPVLRSRVPVSRIKKLIRDRGFALDKHGQPTWFYTAFHREDQDPLTNYTLARICRETAKDSQILVTGCGTGIMLFYLMDQGFRHVEGFDYLNGCVLVASDVARLGGYDTRIWQADGFRPALEKSYDVITALHWVFSAWMGNYGNSAVGFETAKDPATRERLLRDFLSQYAPHVNAGGRMIVELIDAIADYRLESDMAVSDMELSRVYPVRHTPSQVAKCAEAVGLRVESYRMSCSYGYQPRTSYILAK